MVAMTVKVRKIHKFIINLIKILFIVGVTLPWQAKTYIPQNTSVQMNCTVEGSTRNLAWSIQLAGSDNSIRFKFNHSIMLLNNRGFFKLADMTTERTKTIRLVVNSTDGNNGTEIQCIDPGTAVTVNETTIVVFGN